MTTLPAIVDHDSAMQFLFGRINYERTTLVPYKSSHFKLDRMRRLLAGLGDPQLRLPAVHIAGTKGKGSTAGMVAAILRQAGYRTGLYTSPHLEAVEERLNVNGLCCPPDAMVGLLSRIQAVVEGLDAEADATGTAGPTYFEITTAAAMLYFAEKSVDVAVLEVGLGGRLDSTNVCLPEVCAITSISFDHTRQLGNTLTAIAREKAGIIKTGVPVVSGVTKTEPAAAIASAARAARSPLLLLARDLPTRYRGKDDGRWQETFDYVDAELSLPQLRTALIGRHQTENAAVAVAAVRQLAKRHWSISEANIRQGLSAAFCPARIERFATTPVTILDAAHNVASVQALVDVLRTQDADKSRTLVFATNRDKDARGMLERLLPQFGQVFLTRFSDNPRFADPEMLAQVARQCDTNAFVTVVAEPLEAWQSALHRTPGDGLICVAGSFFLIAELRPLLMDWQVTRATSA